MRHDTLIRSLCSLPCGVTVKTFLCRLADHIPGAMQTGLVAGQITAKPAAVAIAFKDSLAVLTADPVIIPDSLRVIAKHIEKMAIWPVFRCWSFASSSLCCRYTRRHDA
jgi:hypothetical protein